MNMAEQKPPIRISEALQLCNLGVPQNQVTWSRVTVSSDRYLCVRYDDKPHDNSQKESQQQVLILDGGNLDQLDTFTMPSVSGAMMHPSQPHLAVRVGENQMMVINKDNKEIMAKCSLSDDIIHWSWVNNQVVVLVTEACVFHWKPYNGCKVERMFDVHERLVYSEIVSYKADTSLRWLALSGLFPQDDHISGITQLYSVHLGLSQCIDSHAVCFAEYLFDGNTSHSPVLCVANREDESNFGKLHVIELGPHMPGNLALSCHQDHIKYTEDEEDKYDFPIAIQVSQQYGLVYIVTKYGWLFLCDLESCACLCTTRICTDVVFAMVLNSATEGVLAISRNGQVLDVELKKPLLVPYIKDVAKKGNQAKRLQSIIDKQETDTLIQLH